MVALVILLWLRDLKRMIVHPHDSGHHRVSVQIEHGNATGCGHVRSRTNYCNFAALDHHVLIVRCHAAGAINQAKVFQHRLRRVYTYVFLYLRRKGRGMLSSAGTGSQKKNCKKR